MPTQVKQLQLENDEMRARLADAETQLQAMAGVRALTPLDQEGERADSLTNDSLNDPETQDDTDPINVSADDSLKDAVTALLRSQQAMMERMDQARRRKQKVYVAMPEQFNGKVGDFIDAWIEKFETWFRHREQVEGTIEERTRIETAIQNTKSEISLDLIHHEADYGAWMTWDAFVSYMRDTYGSSESGYTRFIQLHITTQGNESVNAYYARFRRIVGKQKKRMKHAEDNHIYYYMFIAGLDKKINAEVLRLPESRHMEDMEFHEVLELAKRAEQTVKAHTQVTTVGEGRGQGQGHARKVRTNLKPDLKPNTKGSHPNKYSHEKLTSKEKEFLSSNLRRGGGLIIYEHIRNKREWILWAKKLGICIKCAGKGHHSTECSVADSKPGERQKLNAITMAQDNSIDSSNGMEPDLEYLCSITERGDILLMYHGEINKKGGTVLLDTGATRNYISRRFAEQANLKFKGTVEPHSVRLANGQDMTILGRCEFMLGMSEWTGIVHATVLDLKADFDIVLGTSWHLQ